MRASRTRRVYVEPSQAGGYHVRLEGQGAPISRHDTEEEAQARRQAYARGLARADAQWEERVTLKDGSVVVVRPVRPEDKPLFMSAWTHFGEQSRYQRFLAPKPCLSPDELEFFTHVDHVDHEALGALDVATGEGVAVARYVRDPNRPEVAEAAVAVIDDWQGRGLGGQLLRRLADRASANGIERFSAVLLTTNRAMLHLFEKVGEVTRHRDGEVLELEIELPVEQHEVLAEALRQSAAGVVAAWLDLGAAALIPPPFLRRRS
jgi:GNAT superfamily N-acetyltransferase